MCYAKQKEGRKKKKKRQFVLMKMANCEPQKRKGRFFFVCFLLISFITFPYYLALSNFIMSLSYPFFLYVWSLLFFFSTVFVEIEASSCLYLISQSFLLFFFLLIFVTKLLSFWSLSISFFFFFVLLLRAFFFSLLLSSLLCYCELSHVKRICDSSICAFFFLMAAAVDVKHP